MKPTEEQEHNKKILEIVYTPEKKNIWDEEMEIAGEKFINGEINFVEYMTTRSELRARLGYPA